MFSTWTSNFFAGKNFTWDMVGTITKSTYPLSTVYGTIHTPPLFSFLFWIEWCVMWRRASTWCYGSSSTLNTRCSKSKKNWMLRSIAYRAKNTHPVTMPLTSLLTSLQDASTKVLFGSDSGTGKSQKHHQWGGKRGVMRSDHPRVMRRNSETVEEFFLTS